jgi:hypothetical protein
VAEFCLFNIAHWTTGSTSNQQVLPLDQAELRDVVFDPTAKLYRWTAPHGQLSINQIDQPVDTVWIDAVFDNPKTVQKIKLGYDDAASQSRSTQSVEIIAGAAQSQYLKVAFNGKVSRLALEFDSDDARMAVRQIIINRPIPLVISLWRILGLWLTVTIGLLFVARRWWQIRWQPQATKHRVTESLVIAALIGLLGFTTVTSVGLGADLGKSAQAVFNANQPANDQYRKLTDSLAAGQVTLPEQPSPALVAAEEPYNPGYRSAQGIDYEWDYAYFNGRYYCYFGVVPVVLVLLPYHLITDHHLPTRIAFLAFAILGLVMLWRLWRTLVRRYLPALPFWFYIAGLVTVIAASNLLYLAARATVYETAVMAGMAFALSGVFLALRAKQATGRVAWIVQAAAAAACLALAVGCRPNLLVVSALLPVILWGTWRNAIPSSAKSAVFASTEVPARHLGQLLVAVAIPYLVVAVLLMVYNQVRFGSPTQFGAAYQLTVSNVGAALDKTPLGFLDTLLAGFGANLFAELSPQLVFPFFSVGGFARTPQWLGYIYAERAIGLAYLPLLYCLPILLAVKRRGGGRFGRSRQLLWAMVSVGLVMMVASIIMAGVHGRYQADFLWLFALPALLLLGWSVTAADKNKLPRRFSYPAACLITVATSVIMLSVGMAGEFNRLHEVNPDIHYSVQQLFKFW